MCTNWYSNGREGSVWALGTMTCILEVDALVAFADFPFKILGRLFFVFVFVGEFFSGHIFTRATKGYKFFHCQKQFTIFCENKR
jgi:hypothetical protein